MAATSSLLFLLFTVSYALHQTHSRPINGSFSIELIHRDSPRSPLYNPSATISERWKAAIDRSNSRLRYLEAVTRKKNQKKSTEALEVPVIPTTGEYLMRYGIGSPPITVMAGIDTGSDLIWVNCQPCPNCHRPILDPTRSFTFKKVPCDASACDLLQEKTCSFPSYCTYTATYADSTSTSGDLGKETLTVSDDSGDVQLPDIVFGCSHSSKGFNNFVEAGVVGFNMGFNSFVRQVAHLVNSRFSYCFPGSGDSESGSKMLFGDRAVLSGQPTPFAVSQAEFYYLNLDDISVGADRLNVPPGTFKRNGQGSGGMVLDTGATLTYLVKQGYDILANKVKSVVTLKQKEGLYGMVCFEGTANDLTSGNLPVLTFHIEGLDVPLPQVSSFAETEPGTLCLMVQPSGDLSIFGNHMQQNLLVGIDMAGENIHMVPADCATS